MSSKASKPRPKRRIRLLAPVLLVTVVALAVWMVATVWASFNPQEEVILSSYNSGDNADVTSNFNIPKGDVNFDAVVTYFPPEWGIALDEDVTDGLQVGTLDATATLGLALGPGACNVTLAPSFDLLEATTKGASFTDTGDQIAGTWNGYTKDCPGGLEHAVCNYPGFLDVLFSTRPIARYYGHVKVTTGIEAALNFLVFEPGTSLGAGIPSTASWGFPSVTVLNNTGAAWGGTAPSSLADFCTPLVSNNTVFGKAGSEVVRTNPEFGGTYVFRSWSRGFPDADGDSYENEIDTCPYVTNAGDPRIQGDGDADLDGLDTACDPNDNEAKTDQDADGYHNRADNCPLFANGLVPPQTNQADADEDGIGDDCDDNPNSMDGSRPTKTIEDAVDIEGPAPTTATATATATGTGTATPTPTGTAAATGTPTPTAVAGEGCTPVIPGTYNGLVRLNGVPAASGFEVTASIGGTAWGSAIVSGGRYATDIPDRLPTAAPCFEAGTVTFSIDGATCTPTAQWGSGLHDLDLTCAAAATPTATAVPPTQPPGSPTTATPTKTPTATPAKPPTTGSGGLGGDQDPPLWAMMLAGWAGLTALAGLGTLATRIIKR